MLPRVLLLLLVFLGGLAAAPRPALAHAAPVGASPAPGSVVGTSPAEVTVTFSEAITPVTGQIQVIAPDGERINGTPTVSGAVLRIPVRKADRPLGTYLVSFRVISADSHPVGGAVTFSVGAPSARPEAATATGTHPSVAVAVPALRFLGYAGLALIAGPALFLTVLWPRRRSRRGAVLCVRAGLGLTALATLGGLGTQAQQGSGSALWQVSADELTTVLTSQFGLLLVARLAVLAVLAVLLPPLLRGPQARTAAAPAPIRELVAAGTASASPSPASPPSMAADAARVPSDSSDPSSDSGGVSSNPGAFPPVNAGGGLPPEKAGDMRPERAGALKIRAIAVVLLAVAGLTTWPLTGHAVAAPLPAVTVTVGVVHLAAMAVWIGGLITLAGFLLRGTDRRVLRVVLPVWSRWAALAVLWLAIAGTVQAVVQLGTPAALWQTGYGRLLLVKLGVLVIVLAAAAGARRLVSRAGGAGVLRRLVAVEVAATALILGLSAVLVQVDPGRSAAAKDGAISNAGLSETLSSPLYTLQFNIYPVEIGEYNTVHAFLYTPDGRPLPAEEWEISTRLLDQDLQAVREPLLELNPEHHALGSVTFPIAGTYEIAFTIRIDDLNRATVKTKVTVPLPR